MTTTFAFFMNMDGLTFELKKVHMVHTKQDSEVHDCLNCQPHVCSRKIAGHSF
jgi:hypothetical protein